MVFPVIGQALVERSIFLGSNIAWVASPDRLRFIKLLVLNGLLLDLLSLLLISVLVDLFNLGVLLVLLLFLFVVFNLLPNESR